MGALLNLSLYAGESVQAADLPTPVKVAMDKAAGGAELTDIEKTTNAEGKVVFTAKYLKGKKATMISVNEDGSLVTAEGKGGGEKKKKSK
jgi:hypothetical protein